MIRIFECVERMGEGGQHRSETLEDTLKSEVKMRQIRGPKEIGETESEILKQDLGRGIVWHALAYE